MGAAEVTVNGRTAALGDVPTHTTALDWLRDAGLTGCKEGCAEGECGACSVLVARPGVDRTDRVGRDQRLPDPDRRPRRPGGRHRRGAGRPRRRCTRCSTRWRCAAARSAATARPASSAAWRREYYRPDRAPANGHGRRRARGQRLRPARAERQPLPLHRLPADQRRCLRARRAGDSTTLAARCGAAPCRRRCATAAEPGRSRLRPARDAGRGAAAARTSGRTPSSSPARTDWGVEVNLRGAVPRRCSRSTGSPSCGACRSTTTGSRSAPR